jgi:hypothetical protein
MGMKRNCFVARAIFFRDDLRLACLNEKRGEASFKVRACQFVFFFFISFVLPHFFRSSLPVSSIRLVIDWISW